jgi:hypothetical protein
MFYIFVGLEILTKNAQTRCSLFIFVLLGFHLMQMRNSAFHMKGVIAGPVAFQSDYGQRYNLNTNAEYRSGNRYYSLYQFSYEAECNCYT